MSTLSSLLCRTSTSPAIVLQSGATISQQRLAELVGSIAGQLRTVGVGKGDVVAIAFPEGGQEEAWAQLVVLLAVASIRAVAAPLSASASAETLEASLKGLQAMILVVPSETSNQKALLPLARTLKLTTVCLGSPLSASDPKLAVLYDKYSSQKGLGQRLFVQPGRGRECQEGDVAVAYSKNGLRHKDLVEHVRQTSRENGLTPFDRGLLSLPLHELATLILCLAAISSSSCLSTGRGGGATWIASRDGGRVERVGPHGVRQSSKESKL